jgi:hypothetical protein
MVDCPVRRLHSGDFAAIGAMFSSLPRAEQKKLRSLLERLALSIAAQTRVKTHKVVHRGVCFRPDSRHR